MSAKKRSQVPIPVQEKKNKFGISWFFLLLFFDKIDGAILHMLLVLKKKKKEKP